jgi:hypothetical protein
VRESEPEILRKKKAPWLTNFLGSGKKRPEAKQYAHAQVVTALRAMSHGKCFYCESKGPLTVDHYIEVSENKTLAFEWSNLYLACAPCQRKATNLAIPASTCVDPCDANVTPEEHLEFFDEEVSYKTERGKQTIQKYRLAAGVSERRRVLRNIDKEIRALTKRKGWQQLDEEEKTRLWRRFAHDTAEYAMMARAYLRANGLAPEP